MADYGYADIGKLADFANNTIGGLTANDIMRFPRANVPPVKHGRWLPKSEDDIYEFSECSECGNIESCETPFCAQCGARMDGDTE